MCASSVRVGVCGVFVCLFIFFFNRRSDTDLGMIFEIFLANLPFVDGRSSSLGKTSVAGGDDAK